MDNPNPIRYADLITPDNSITNLIAQLDELIAKYESMKSKLQGAASETIKSVQGISGATEEQRKSIQLATEQSEKLLSQYMDTRTTLKDLNAKYKDGNLALKEFTKIQKLVDEVNRSAEGSYNRLSAQYRLNKIRLNEMGKAERETTEAGRQLVKESNAIYEEMNRLQKETGKAQLQVGHYERALGGLLGVNPKVISTLTDSKQAVSAFGGVLKALSGPVGIAIGVIGGLTAAFKLFKDSIHATQTTGDAFDYEMGAWTATWDVFKKSVSAVDFHGFIVGATEAAAAGRNLKMVLDETFERTNSARILRASMSQENAVLQEAMRDQRLTLDERIKAGQQYLDNMEPIYAQEQETARRNADAQLEYLFSVTNRVKYEDKFEREAAKAKLANYIKNYNLNEANIKLAQDYLKAEKDVESERAILMTTTDATQRKYHTQQLQNARERVAAASENTKAVADVLRQYNFASNAEIQAYVQAEEQFLNAQAAAYNDQKRIVTMVNNLEAQKTQKAEAEAKTRKAIADKEAKDQAAADAKAQADAERARVQAIADQRAILNAQLQSIQLQIAATRDGTQEMLDLRLDMIQKQREIELFENQQKAIHLRQDEAAINAKFDAMQLKVWADFNTQMAQRDLAAMQDLADKEFDLLDRNERQKTIFRLQQEKARLETILKINETATEKMTEAEIAAIKAAIAGIEKEVGTLPYNNLYELLGINLDSQQQSALNTALNTVKDSIGSIADSWAEAANKAVESANKQVDAAQKVLDAEIEARNAGYANNVEMAQKELALAQTNQQKALKEQEKAQKAQLAIDSITQASSLITASANLWKTLSAVSPVLAIAAIATMWTSFAAAKIRAAQVTKPTEMYGDGTVELLQGGSHASGHDIDLGTKRDGTRRRAEGGEYFAIINKRNSRRFRNVIPDVINSFNDGTFADRYQRANAAMAGYAVGMIGGGNTDVSGIERDVAAIRKQGDETRIIDAQGNIIIRYKNLTRKIKS